jgi:hypothetical protein
VLYLSHDGEMQMIIDTIKTYLPTKHKQNPNGWISFNCPACVHNGHKPDTRGRGGIIFTHNGFSYHCFNCSFSTKWEEGSYFNKKNIDFMYYLDVPDDIISKCRFYALGSTGSDIGEISIPKNIYALPENSKKISELIKENNTNKNFMKVLEYIANRNVNLLEWYDFYWCDSEENELKNRFIIPVYSDNRILGWSARSVLRNPKVKYIAQINKQFVFNSDLLYDKNRKFCVIVEGELDAISINATATMKNTITDGQLKTYNSSPQQKIVYPDKGKSGKELVEVAIDQGWWVSFPEWDSKDAADAVAKYGRLVSVTHILNTTLNSPLQIKLKSKKYFEV